jgi:membrane fusion protein (multidrug efflux system)
MLQRNKNGEAQFRLVEKPQDVGTPEQEPANDIGAGDATRPTDAKALPIRARATAHSLAPESSPVPNAGVTAKAKGKRKPLLMAAAALLLAGAGWYGYDYMTVSRFVVSTDDAYVHADATTLAAKVPGYVSKITVSDNTYVAAGDVVARIDDGDFRLAADSARDKIGTQQASIARIGQQVVAQEAAVEQARAQLASSQAAVRLTQSNFNRQQALAARAIVSQELLEQSQANRDQAAAALQSAQSALSAAIANVGVLKAEQQEGQRQLQELKTALAKAERDLSFTVIRAPIDGVMGNRAMQVGDFVQTGQRLASLVPLSAVYVDANFKETQLANLQPGQPVSIKVDALPDRAITGTVVSVSPASGSMFSLLPPDNATGNFTKIVQRLTVRIHLPEEVVRKGVLRPGMSVVVGVNTKPGLMITDNDARSGDHTGQVATAQSAQQ